MKTSKHTQIIIDFICDTKYEDIPAVAIENAKGRILDWIGVTIKGGTESVGSIIKEFVKQYGGKELCTIVNGNAKTDVLTAAFANGTLSHAIDYDDHFVLSHPTIGVLPAVFPVAEMVGASGKDIITAYIIGLEVYTKIQQCTSTEPWYKGFHASGIWGCLSAVAAAGKLLNLNKDQMLMAWGTACSSFCGLKRNMGTMTKPYHCGRAAEGGVRSALLAKMGFTSHAEAFEGRFGFLNVFVTQPRFEYIEQLGRNWDLIEHPTLIKPHPSCGGTHAAMNGMLELIRKYDFNEEDVSKVETWMNQGGVDSLYYPDPNNIYEAKFSMQFVMALLLHFRRWGLDLHTDEVVRSPEMKALYSKVHFGVDEALDKEIPRDMTDYHAIVQVTLKDGTMYRIRSMPPILSFEEIRTKFNQCVDGILPDKKREEIVSAVLNIENFETAAEFMKTIA